MREHKFRAKALDNRLIAGSNLYFNNEWVYGNLIIADDGVAIIQTWDRAKGIGYIHNTLAVVNPDTVGEYTGLHDRNGKDGYEHDIIKTSVYNGLYADEWIAEIVFENGQFGVRYGDLYKEFYPLSRFSKVVKTEYIPNVGEVAVETEPTFEVIGNRFENPELLKGRDGE